MTSRVRNPFVSSAIMPINVIASSRSIYATTPNKDMRSKKVFLMLDNLKIHHAKQVTA
ncbi:MAG: hypothetical protein VB140_02255 [Burkholderia sp.]